MLAGGKGLGYYELPAQGGHVRKTMCETGVFSAGGSTALFLDGAVLYAAGGKGLASFDTKAMGLPMAAGPSAAPNRIPAAAAPTMMQVVVPAGTSPGQQFSIQTPDGRVVPVICPEGVQPGQAVMVPA